VSSQGLTPYEKTKVFHFYLSHSGLLMPGVYS